MLAHLIRKNKSNSPERNELIEASKLFIDDLTSELNIYYTNDMVMTINQNKLGLLTGSHFQVAITSYYIN